MNQKRLYKQLIIEIGLASLNEINLVDECSNSINETLKAQNKNIKLLLIQECN